MAALPDPAFVSIRFCYPGPKGSPLWEATIDKIFGGNAELIGFFGGSAAAAMLGKVVEHILPILWGSGSNGKSLIIEMLLEAMGPDYADKGEGTELMLASRGEGLVTRPKKLTYMASG